MISFPAHWMLGFIPGGQRAKADCLDNFPCGGKSEGSGDKSGGTKSGGTVEAQGAAGFGFEAAGAIVPRKDLGLGGVD